MHTGKILAQLRNRKGWTQAQLAERVAMTQAHINKLENDKMKPRPKTLERLAEALGVTVDELTLASQSPLASDIVRFDPELSQLLNQIAILTEEQRGALRTFLHSMITCQQIQRLTTSKAS